MQSECAGVQCECVDGCTTVGAEGSNTNTGVADKGVGEGVCVQAGYEGRTAHPLGGRDLVLRCHRLGLRVRGGRATVILHADRACTGLSGAGAVHTAQWWLGGGVDMGASSARVRVCG